MGIIKSKEELISKMEFYKKIYSKEIIDYYNSLIELEISSLNKDYIPEDVLEYLRHTNIYNDIVRFNIYENALITLNGDARLKRLYTDPSILDFIIPSKIKDYRVFTYNPNKDEIKLYDLIIDEEYRKRKIKEIEKNRIDVIDIQLANVLKDITKYKEKNNVESFDLNVEKDQLIQSKEIASLEIKALNERKNKEEYANSIKNIVGGYKKDFSDYYNIDSKEKILKIGNTKVVNNTYHY